MVCGGPKEEMGGSLTGVKLAGGAVGITVGPRRKLVTGGMRTRSITWITELPADKLGVTMEASSVPISIVPLGRTKTRISKLFADSNVPTPFVLNCDIMSLVVRAPGTT